MGGAVAGIEAGFQQGEIEQAAYEYAKSIDDDERVIVGLNKFAVPTVGDPDIFPVDPHLESGQKATLTEFKAARDTTLVQTRLADVIAAARGTQNLLGPMKEALRANATLGEVSDALRSVFGVYRGGS
jgi:methylmalonyl-CoA mutase N-terminal domain/subunit